jgi:Domain of unknown function (DUF4157)
MAMQSHGKLLGAAARSVPMDGATPDPRRIPVAPADPASHSAASRIPLQKKLAIGATNDPLEHEADRVADRVMRMPDPAAIHSTTGAAPNTMQRKCAVSAAPQSAAAPPIVREVLHSAGQPLDHTTRTFFEPRLGHDLSGVRTHTDSRAADSAEAVDALAYTSGNDIVFSHGQYSPGTASGQRLLAHELAHVAQQQQLASPTHSGLLQRTTKVPFGKGKSKRIFTIGELRFTPAAREDVLKHGALLPGPDQAHTIFHGDQLGYEDGYTPTDPFRWSKIKDLIDSDQKILVKKVALGDPIDVLFVSAGTNMIVHDVMKPLGLTLPTLKLQQALALGQKSFTASPMSDTHLVLYTTALGKPDESSLAHELLGHLWLAMKGVPFSHPSAPADVAAFGTLTAAHNVLDPFGNVFTGTVKDFITTFVGSEQGMAFKSPTQNVSAQAIPLSLAAFETGFEKKASGNLNGKWDVPSAVAEQLEILSNNYAIIPNAAASTTAPATSPTPSPAAPTTAAPTVSKAAIEADLTKWYNNLSVDRQYVLISFLRDLIWQMNRRSELAAALVHSLQPPPGMAPPTP